MNFELSIEDFTIITNALHYYKKEEGRKGEFREYTDDRINLIRDKMAYQLVPSPRCKPIEDVSQ